MQGLVGVQGLVVTMFNEEEQLHLSSIVDQRSKKEVDRCYSQLHYLD